VKAQRKEKKTWITDDTNGTNYLKEATRLNHGEHGDKAVDERG
jgi:hypothetical protein